MKTNTERLFDALTQVDDSAYLEVDDVALAADGRWETEPLEGALTEHLVPLSSIVRQKEPSAVYLREAWAEGTTDDGRNFEVAAAGTTLVLSIGKFGTDEREVYELRLQDLAPAWLRAVGAVKP
jgi:hypothetical protein